MSAIPILPHIPFTLLAPDAAPFGYETVWGFLMRTEPATLAIMLDPVAGLAGDDLRARRIATRMGSPFALLPVNRR